MERITIANLRNAVKYLNKTAGYHESGLAQDKDGKFRPVPGAYVLDVVYGGYRLNRYTIGGGERHVTDRLPARAIYGLIHAYIEGLEVGLRKGGTTPTIDQHILVEDICVE